jgi:hypothetical protein
MKLSANCVSIVTFIVASACGAPEDGTYIGDVATDDTQASDEAAESAGNLETLHRFEVQGATYTYLGDGDAVLLHVQAPRTAPQVRVLTETGEQPTLLEGFSALQPGVVAHPALVAAHRESALLLGRENDTVLTATVVVAAADVVEKTAADLADCRGYFLPVWGGGFGGGTPVVTTLEGFTSGTTVQASTASVSNKFMAAGACNFSAVQSRVVAFEKRTGAAGAWVAQVTASIAVDDVNYIVHTPSASVVNLRSRMVDAANLGMQLVAARRQ